jgi:hypothetical protein
VAHELVISITSRQHKGNSAGRNFFIIQKLLIVNSEANRLITDEYIFSLEPKVSESMLDDKMYDL